MTYSQLLEFLGKQRVKLWIEGERLCYDAAAGVLTATVLHALREHKTALMNLLQPAGEQHSQFPSFLNSLENQETRKLEFPSLTGTALLMPYFCLIQAAHLKELPAEQVIVGSDQYDVSEYICRVSAGIWYGVTLDDPLLPAWLENFRRLQNWYERQRHQEA